MDEIDDTESALLAPNASVVIATPVIKRRNGIRVGIAVVVVLAAVVAVSFFWKIADPKPQHSLASAATATQQLDSVRFELDADVGGAAIGLKGVMDVKGRVTQMDLDGSAIPGAPPDAKIAAIMDMANLVMYMGGDVFGQELPEGKTWVRIDLNKLAETMGEDLSGLTQGSTNDPLSAAALAETASKVTDLGPETILGTVEAEHFQFEVSIDDALKAAGTTRAKILGGDGGALPDIVVYDAWVDSDNYLRQLEFNLSGDGREIHYTVRYTEINPSVTIVVPTPDESVDVFDLIGA